MVVAKSAVKRGRAATVKTFPVTLKVPSAILRQVNESNNADQATPTVPSVPVVVKLPPFRPKGFAAVNLGNNTIKREEIEDREKGIPGTNQSELKIASGVETSEPSPAPTPTSISPTTSTSTTITAPITTSTIPPGTKPPPRPRGRKPGQIYTPKTLTPKPPTNLENIDDETESSADTPFSTGASTPNTALSAGTLASNITGGIMASSIITGPRIAGLKSLPLGQQIRPLDRSGKPCRKWVKAKVELKSFTGVKWEISGVWNGGPVVETTEGDTTKKEDAGFAVVTEEAKKTKHDIDTVMDTAPATTTTPVTVETESKEDKSQPAKLAPIILKLNSANIVPTAESETPTPVGTENKIPLVPASEI